MLELPSQSVPASEAAGDGSCSFVPACSSSSKSLWNLPQILWQSNVDHQLQVWDVHSHPGAVSAHQDLGVPPEEVTQLPILILPIIVST